MIKKILFIGFALLLVLLALNKRQTLLATGSQKIYSPQETEQIIEQFYANTSGFNINNDEREMIEKEGGNPTYGEFTVEGVNQLLQKIPMDEKDVFYDLGCGTGKICVQIALSTPAQAIGVELSPTRIAIAQKVKKELMHNKILRDTAKLQFKEENITKTDIAYATVILLCSTCFSDQLMQELTTHMEHVATASGKPLTIITLKKLPESALFSFTDTYYLPMTWSESSPVYIYKSEKNKD